nr:hypothetical protein [Tanacetum cinerariifolium]
VLDQCLKNIVSDVEKNLRNPRQAVRGGYRHVKVLKFFDCLSPRQGVEDLRELLHKAEDTTRSTYLVNRSPSSGTRFKKPIDMLGFFGWLASIKQWMLEPVYVKCIFLGYHKSIVGNKLWRLDDVTSKVVLYRNMGFNESEEYKKTFIGSGVGTGSVHVLQGVKFEDLIYYHPTRDREQYSAWELFSYREDYEVAAVEKIYAHELLTFNDTVAYDVISKWKARLKEDMDAEIWVTKGLLDKAKENVLGMKIIKDQSVSLEGSLSVDCDVEKNGKWSCIYAVGCQEYQMVCTRLDIASTDVGSLKVNLQHMKALSTTKAKYMTFTEAWKKEIWLKGLLTESRYELKLIAGIATGALVKGGSRSEVPTQVEVTAYRY